MSKTTNRFSAEVRARADHASEHSSRWAAVSSIAAKIGCTAQSLNEWVKKAEVDSGDSNETASGKLGAVRARLMLAQNRNDLLSRKSPLLHQSVLRSRAGL